MTHYYSFLVLTLVAAVPFCAAAEIHVSPAGSDTGDGTIAKPFSTIGRAQEAARGAKEATVVLQAGTYYLPATLVLTAEDSGTQYRAAKGEKVVLSGGRKLDLTWKPYRDGILQAAAPPDLAADQLFVNGARQPMARYPNYDENAHPYNGAAADAFSKARAARWADPAGGFIHAMHAAHWGGYHYRITGKKPDGEVTYEGGWQNNRQMGMHRRDRFVENIFEELDAPGEWFLNTHTGTLYYYPPEGLDLAKATVEAVRLRHLVEFRGTQQRPVRGVALRGLTFRHAARTFMDTKEPLLRSDWTVYRGGAVFLTGSEDCTIADCEFDQLGGNAVFVSGYNRRVRITGCDIHDTGATAVAFVGEPKAVRNPLFEYRRRQALADIDKTPGPKTEDYPADCVVDDCLLRRFGMVEKQATGVEISMSRGITVRHCTIYEASRAGINIGDGCWGGHLIEFCDVFDTVLETGDHGSFNSWGRDRYWKLRGAAADDLPALALLDAVKPTILRNNRWRCDHGWDVDLDDGSSNYEIYNNLFLHGGLKLREGFGRRVWNNIAVNNSLHPHVWYPNSGDMVTRNIWMGPYRPAVMSRTGHWGKEVDYNLFASGRDADRTKFAAHGCDAHSLAADAQFVDPASGDYRVKDTSPALKLGFKNFPMDRFGVQKPELRKIARTPKLPGSGEGAPAGGTAPGGTVVRHYWQQALLEDLKGEEYSAFGVSKESGGVAVRSVLAGSAAARDGFEAGDLIQSVNGRPVKKVADLRRLQNGSAGGPLAVGIVRGQKPRTLRVEKYVSLATETAPAAGAFKLLPIVPLGGTIPIRKVSTRPGTKNDPPRILHDGLLAARYGPVFGNGVGTGAYKVDLGAVADIAEVRTWSHNLNNRRGPQHFVLFGSSAATDPGWNVDDGRTFTPIAEVDTTLAPAGRFCATSIHPAGEASLGRFRWLVWRVYPVTGLQENTAYQEIQVCAKRGDAK